MLLRGEYHHDGSGELMYIGTMESVPALLKVLEMHPGFDRNAPRPSSSTVYHPTEEAKAVQPEPEKRPRRMVYICTYVHAVLALQKITGQDIIEYEDWIKWWDEYQKTHPKSKSK